MDQNTDLPLVPMKVIYWHTQKTYVNKLINLIFVKMEYIQNL